MSDLNTIAERYLTNGSRTQFRELVCEACHDFDGRVLQPRTYRIITREDIVRAHGEEIIALIPQIIKGTWTPGPELLGLEPDA